MVKLSKRHSHKRRSHPRRSRRSYGGVAPIDYKDDWSAKMSAGQSTDFLKYHAGQHGGALQGADLSSIGGDLIPSQLRGAAHVGGIDNAFAQIRGYSDLSGGRRRSRKAKKAKKAKKGKKGGKSRKVKKGGKSRKVKKNKSSKRSRRQRRRGGAMGYAPFPSGGMLLSPSEQAGAGLNPTWGGVEVNAARMREAL